MSKTAHINMPRRLAAVALIGWLLSLVLLWGPHRLGVLHPYHLTFLLLLFVTVCASFGGFITGIRRRQEIRALAWACCALTPLLLWAALGWYGFHQMRKHEFPSNLPFTLIKLAGASLMESQAAYQYRYRFETARLVMFYDANVPDPAAGSCSLSDRDMLRGK